MAFLENLDERCELSKDSFSWTTRIWTEGDIMSTAMLETGWEKTARLRGCDLGLWPGLRFEILI